MFSVRFYLLAYELSLVSLVEFPLSPMWPMSAPSWLLLCCLDICPFSPGETISFCSVLSVPLWSYPGTGWFSQEPLMLFVRTVSSPRPLARGE